MHVSAQFAPPKSCTQNSDCAMNNGESCDTAMKMCIKRCTQNSDCSKGESCIQRMCIQQNQNQQSQTSGPSPGPSFQQNQNQQGGSSNMANMGGSSNMANMGPKNCTQNSDCSNGESCLQGNYNGVVMKMCFNTQ